MRFVVVACGYCIMNSQFVSSLDSLFLSEMNCAFREIDEFSAEPPHFPHFNHLPPQRPNASSTHQTAYHHKLSTNSTHANRNNHHPLPSNSHTHSPLSTDANESKSESGGWCRKKKKKKKPKTQNQEVSPAAGSVIHVRARRGQATDRHSLAERIRREKISQRTKVLQTLVPGCHKVTGKARMLDEIINYVQSLQNQVEFLSMKLASVNSILYDFGMDHPEIWQGNGNGMVSHSQQAELAYNMATCNTYQATGGSDSPAGNSSCFIPLDVNPSPLFLEHGNNTSLVQLP